MVRALMDRARLGRDAEAKAAALYEADGYTVEARNWRGGGGELDVVASKGGLLVFIEVRARSSGFAGGALASVTPAKQRRVARAADAYLRARRGAAPENYRFDVVGILKGEVTRVEGAFYPPWAF